MAQYIKREREKLIKIFSPQGRFVLELLGLEVDTLTTKLHCSLNISLYVKFKFPFFYRSVASFQKRGLLQGHEHRHDPDRKPEVHVRPGSR